MKRLIYGVSVVGSGVDAQTRCAHYKSPLDIIAIKFKCCGEWFPCFECHTECAGHEPRVWTRNEFHTPAVLCGNCGHQLTVSEYLQSGARCLLCDGKFNPACANHYHLYFEI